VLLNQLFAFAREHNPSRYVRPDGDETTPHLFPASTGGNDEFVSPSGNSLASGEQNVRPGLTALSQDRVSIINLLSNEEVLSPPSRPKTPPRIIRGRPTDPNETRTAANRHADATPREGPMVDPQHARNEQTANVPNPLRTSTSRSNQAFMVSPTRTSKIRLEKVYFHVFMNNLHHLHPFLDPIPFERRCERDVWSTHATSERQKGFRHFFALYNIVIAVGALIAGSHVIKELGRDMQSCVAQLAESESSERVMSSQAFSRVYFRRSKDLLGDTSAVCSLESAQTLLLMVSRHYSRFKQPLIPG